MDGMLRRSHHPVVAALGSGVGLAKHPLPWDELGRLIQPPLIGGLNRGLIGGLIGGLNGDWCSPAPRQVGWMRWLHGMAWMRRVDGMAWMRSVLHAHHGTGTASVELTGGAESERFIAAEAPVTLRVAAAAARAKQHGRVRGPELQFHCFLPHGAKKALLLPGGVVLDEDCDGFAVLEHFKELGTAQYPSARGEAHKGR